MNISLTRDSMWGFPLPGGWGCHVPFVRSEAMRGFLRRWMATLISTPDLSYADYYRQGGGLPTNPHLNFPFLASEDHLAGFHMQQAFRITLFNCYRFSHQSASIWRIEYDVFYLALHRIGLHCTMLYNERLQSCGWQIGCFKKVEIYCH